MTSIGGNGDHLLAFGALACTGLIAYPKRPAILLADLLADALGLALGCWCDAAGTHETAGVRGMDSRLRGNDGCRVGMTGMRNTWTTSWCEQLNNQ